MKSPRGDSHAKAQLIIWNDDEEGRLATQYTLPRMPNTNGRSSRPKCARDR